MTPAIGIGIVLVMIAIIALVVTIETNRQKMLRDEMGRWFVSRGFTEIAPTTPATWHSEAVVPMDKGIIEALQADMYRSNGRVRLAAKGLISGRQVLVFEYYYSVSTGKSRRTVRKSVGVAEIPTAVPSFMIRRQDLWDDIKALFGYNDIHCGDAEFDKRFFLACDHQAFVKSLMSPQAKTLVQQHGELLFRGVPGFVLAVRTAEISPALADELVSCVVELAELAERTSGRS